MYIYNKYNDYRPSAKNNQQSAAMIKKWFRKRGNRPATLEEVRAVIGHIPHPHGCMVRYLARQGRMVLLEV